MKAKSRSDKGDKRNIELAIRYPAIVGVPQVGVYSESQGLSPFPISHSLPQSFTITYGIANQLIILQPSVLTAPLLSPVYTQEFEADAVEIG